jgi:hypothetical protein
MIWLELIVGIGTAVLVSAVFYAGYVAGRFIERMKRE